jgi:hypothetical protein
MTVTQNNATRNCSHDTVNGNGKMSDVMISLLKNTNAIDIKK